MRKYQRLLFYGLLFTFAGCRSPKDKISKLWMYTYYSGPPDSKKTHFSPTSFLLLNYDGTYTRDFGTFEYGRWQLNNDQLILLHQDSRPTIFTFSTDGHDMRLTGENTYLINFESSPLSLEEAENPFSVNHNKWRIKATRKETDSQLIGRLVNHFGYWEAYFNWAIQNNLTTVDVRSTATPIKLYSNGFTLKPLSELPREWISSFYDEQDCIRANSLLEQEIKKNTIAWAHTDNKYKMFIGAFQQLQDHLLQRN